jgi:hypothetical protein
LSTEQPQGPEGGQPSEEELRAAFEEQMRRITVPDVIVQTAVTLVNLGAQKLGEDGDLEQAKMAIDGARALMPLLPDEIQAPVKDALSQLQMAFVREAQGGGEPPADAAQGGDPGAGGAQPGGPGGAGGAQPGGPGGAQQPGAGGPGEAQQPGAGGAQQPSPGGAGAVQPDPDEAERAKARSKIWTPPGT